MLFFSRKKLKNLFKSRKYVYFALCFVAHPFKAPKNDALKRDMRLRW